MPALPSSSTISRTECYVIRCATSTSGRSAFHCAASIAGNYAFNSTLHATPSAARPAARSAVPAAPSATPSAAHLLTTTERCPARRTNRATVHSTFYNAISGTALRSMAPSDALSVQYGQVHFVRCPFHHAIVDGSNTKHISFNRTAVPFSYHSLRRHHCRLRRRYRNDQRCLHLRRDEGYTPLIAPSAATTAAPSSSPSAVPSTALALLRYQQYHRLPLQHLR